MNERKNEEGKTMKKTLISLLLVFSFLLNTVPMAFAIEDGAEQTEDTTVSLVDQIGEDDANTEGELELVMARVPVWAAP